MADQTDYRPYIDPKEKLKELTLQPLILGAIMAVVLGAANVYLGLKAGMTVAATFPAAVISMAVLRLFRGNILEENIARTTGAVGEALAAGAIFTIPAFVIVGVWGNIDVFSANWFLATALIMVGGMLGVLLMILLRRTFMEDASLPFPESQACTEIVKAGQGGATGAGAVFAAMGLAGVLELLKNGNGIPIIGRHFKGVFGVGKGTFPFFTPEPSPAFLAVGYIIGPKYGAITAAGGIFGWMFLMPILLYMMSLQDASFAGILADLANQGQLGAIFSGTADYPQLQATIGEFAGLKSLYSDNIKMIAIGAMIVGAFFTLFKMRSNLIAGIGRSVKSLGGIGGGGGEGAVLRTDRDLNIKFVFFAIALSVLAMLLLYWVLCGSLGVSFIVTVVMTITAFLFAAVAGFLVSIIGSSSNPISGLTLSTLLIAAGLLTLLGMGGGYLSDGSMSPDMKTGVLAVLGVATVVCCVAGVAGDMAQDWKVGYLLGGTPWRMEVGGFIGVLVASVFLVVIITLLHNTTPGGIGGDLLPAPQAGLMAVTAKGIISGQLAWELILMGVLFAVGLIFIGVPSPMLIAVGMYLPFETTTAIFAGGVIKWIATLLANRKTGEDKQKMEAVENRGLLIASGFVAGEALMGIVLAILVAAKLKLFAPADKLGKLVEEGYTVLATLPSWFEAKWLGGLVILGLAIYMVRGSLQALSEKISLKV